MLLFSFAMDPMEKFLQTVPGFSVGALMSVTVTLFMIQILFVSKKTRLFFRFPINFLTSALFHRKFCF